MKPLGWEGSTGWNKAKRIYCNVAIEESEQLLIRGEFQLRNTSN